MRLESQKPKFKNNQMFEDLQNENKYLKREIKKEREKFEKHIIILHKELAEVKEDNRILSRQIDNYINRKILRNIS
tara:strand:+ start:678 stop:905 length:228 start_codon:yes stop_codon:yes gene_type:complete